MAEPPLRRWATFCAPVMLTTQHVYIQAGRLNDKGVSVLKWHIVNNLCTRCISRCLQCLTHTQQIQYYLGRYVDGQQSMHIWISISARHLLYCMPHPSGCIVLAFHLYQQPENKPLWITHSNYLLSEAPRWTKRGRLKKHNWSSRPFVVVPSPLIEK